MAVPEIVRITPPALLLLPTPEPPCIAATNGDLFSCWQDMRDALARANADKAALKSWAEAGERE